MVEAAKLDKKARGAIPDEHFAVPGKRKLPLNDERHTRLAWDMVERTHGLTPAEKSEARRRIIKRAKELGIDTSDWHKVKAMRLDAMALNIANDGDHPNKMPFSGVLTRVDEPSDEPPSGSNGRRVFLTTAAAEKALSSLLGMAVNYQPDFAGHDPKAKIGIITAANIVGTAIEIEGFIYAADFPEVAERIRADKAVLGFSFEAQNLYVADPASDPLEIVDCVFTGAAILRKDKAAYQSTSLAARAELETSMTNDELKALLGETIAAGLAPLNERLAKIESEQHAAIESEKARIDAERAKIEANKNVMDQVEPHAKAVESCAAAMESAGFGCDAKRGHVVALRGMASSMRASAAVGQVPHIWRDHDYPYYANADRDTRQAPAPTPAPTPAPAIDAAAIAKAVEEAVKPLNEKLAAASTQIADLKAGVRRESPEPQRKTLTPAISAILARASIEIPEGDGKLSVASVDKALSGLNMAVPQRIEIKTALTRAGLMN